MHPTLGRFAWRDYKYFSTPQHFPVGRLCSPRPSAVHANRWTAGNLQDEQKEKVRIMAPRFTTFMYQVYPTDNGADALVCFPFAQSESIFLFRDKLTEALLKIGNIQVHRAQGYPLPPDSTFRFYSENHAISVEKFLQKKRQSFFSRLMNSAEWVSFQKEERLVGKMIDTEIETSHDFPCVIIHSHIHSEKTISELIQKIAKDLKMDMPRNTQLGLIEEVVTSNWSFNF